MSNTFLPVDPGDLFAFYETDDPTGSTGGNVYILRSATANCFDA